MLLLRPVIFVSLPSPLSVVEQASLRFPSLRLIWLEMAWVGSEVAGVEETLGLLQRLGAEKKSCRIFPSNPLSLTHKILERNKSLVSPLTLSTVASQGSAVVSKLQYRDAF